MATATRKLGDGAASGSWHVRNEQGETFGPVDFETLRAWARDGRLAPTSEISDTAADWRLATAFRELEMDWVAEVTPGTFYGPIHRRAMQELMKDGSLSSKSVFFFRRGLEESAAVRPTAAGPADAETAGEVRRLTEAAETARQRAETCEELVRQAQKQVAAYAAQVEQAQRQVAAYEEQVRVAHKQLSAEAERAAEACRTAEAAEARRLESDRARDAAQARAETARQTAESEWRGRLAACEEQVRAGQKQAEDAARHLTEIRHQAERAETQRAETERARVAAAEQAERMRVQMTETGLRLNEAERRCDEQAGRAQRQAETYDAQVRAAQQQSAATVAQMTEAFSALRQTFDERVLRAEEAVREREERVTALESRRVALETERQTLQTALTRAQSDLALRDARLSQAEKSASGAADGKDGRSALEARILALGAEAAALRQEAARERQAAREAETRCVALAAALEEAKVRSGDASRMEALAGQIGAVQRRLDQVFDVFQTLRAAEAAEREERARLRAVPVEVEVLPPEKKPPVDEPRRPAPEPVSVEHPGGGSPSGLSLADLERQARRELERLGAQGAHLFKKKGR